MESLIYDSKNFDSIILNLGFNPINFTDLYSKFIFLCKKALELNKLNKKESNLVRSDFF
jgi:hypothetical protein